MSQLQFAGHFMRSVKEALKRSYWSAYYFTNKKGNLYPPTESYIDYRELLLVLPKKRHLFILLYQMRRNYELKAIAVLEQLVNEQYAKKQQWPKQGCFLTILNPRNNRGLFSWYGKVISYGKGSGKMWLSNTKCLEWRVERKSKQINLTLHMKRMICFKYQPSFRQCGRSVSFLCQLFIKIWPINQDSSFVVITTRATTEWTQKIYLKKTPLFNRYIFFVYSVDTYLFFYNLLWRLLVSNCWICLRKNNPHWIFSVP